MIDLLLEEGAVSDGNASQVKDLLNRREKRLPGNRGNIVHNPLIAAARDTDSAKLMAMLVDAGASLESRDKNGWDLFLYSFHEDHPSILGYLLNHYPFPEEETQKEISNWLLYEGIRNLAVECTRMLLKKGLDIHTTFADPSMTNEKTSVLHLIGEGGGYKRDNSYLEDQQIQDLQNQMIRLLVEQGADLYAEETMGETPLDFREDKDPEIYEILRPYYN